MVPAVTLSEEVTVQWPPEVNEYFSPPKDAEWAQGIVNSTTHGIGDDQTKLVVINRLIAARLEHLSAHPGNLSDRQIWELGNGWCDNVSRLFITLAKAAGYPARLLVLKHPDGSNEHVVAEAYYGGEWHLFDPDHAVEYYLPDGTVAGFDDLAKDQAPVLATNDPWTSRTGVGMEGFYQLPMAAHKW